jgi:Domain of unknown function (DUF4157)
MLVFAEKKAAQRSAPAGKPLPAAVRNAFEPRFGHDFSRMRVHSDDAAAASASALNAEAYTSGLDIVFAAGRYAPSTPAGAHLLAHELAHAVQQASGAVAPGLSRPGDAHERVADAIASRVLAGRNAGALLPPATAVRETTPAAVQRQYASSTATASDPNALIPIADFITYVEAVERAYSSDTPQQILTRIRQQYYSGTAFAQLIPDAPMYETIPGHLITGPSGVPLGPSAYVPSRTIPRTIDPSVGAAAYSHLTAHADENAIGDNPSPYIVMPDGSRVDVGHLLLGLDSLLHPRVAEPFASYGIPGIDPASWAADLALASYWTSYHIRNGSPASDAAIKPSTADFNAYYNASAPNEDLLGDADAFGTFQQNAATPGQTLSQVMRAYYLGASGAAPGVQRRWRTFCAANGLGYTVSGGTVTWAATLEAVWEPRISRLCDLFDAGFFSKVGSFVLGTSPARGSWPFSLPALRRFLAWLKPKLEAEIAAHP